MTDIKDLTLDELKPRLVEAMLQHVPFDGWSDEAATNAAHDLGIAPAVARLAFRDQMEMIETYAVWADQRMEESLSTPEFATLKIRDRITSAIRTRLEQAAPHREALRRATAIMALPHHAPRAAALAFHSADAIWRAAGDRSTDFSFYSRRAIASGVYAATLLVWLDDDSEGFVDSWNFLDRRIGDVMRFERAKARFRSEAHRPSLTRFLGRLRYPIS